MLEGLAFQFDLGKLSEVLVWGLMIAVLLVRPTGLFGRTTARELTWSFPQQLAHHTTSGCPMTTGDLLGSGTLSGPKPDEAA